MNHSGRRCALVDRKTYRRLVSRHCDQIFRRSNEKHDAHEPCRITWDEFRQRYDDEKLASLSANSREATNAAFNHLEAIVNPHRLSALSSEQLSLFQAGLR